MENPKLCLQHLYLPVWEELVYFEKRRFFLSPSKVEQQ